jgi:hypothetical protein
MAPTVEAARAGYSKMPFKGDILSSRLIIIRLELTVHTELEVYLTIIVIL